MNENQIYIIITKPKNTFGLYKYAFECRAVEFYKEDSPIIIEQFYKSTGINPIDEPVVDIEEADFLYFVASKK